MKKISEELIREVKRNLDIIHTLEDDDELKIVDLIEDGMAVLESKAGNPNIDWTDSFNKRLLKEYVRFAYNGMVDYFDVNFQSPILEFCIVNEVIEDGL